MNLRIYQGFYKYQHTFFLEPNWIPYDNSKGDQVHLEYSMWKNIYEIEKNKGSHYGISSWRWREKTQLPGTLFEKWILSEPGYDVYFIDPYMQGLHFNNLWEQGETAHSGMINFVNRLFSTLGYNINFSEFKYLTDEFSTCHYFFGNDHFWNSYFKFLDYIIKIVKEDKILNSYIFEEYTEYRERKYINFPFVVERLFSMFLIFNQDIKYKKYPYESYCYKLRFGETYEILLNHYYNKKIQDKLILESRKLILPKGNFYEAQC